jgi:hypothetical protein
MKVTAPIRCRHCGRAVMSPDDPEFFQLRFRVIDPHTDQWSCGECLTAQDNRRIASELDLRERKVVEVPEVTPDDITAAAREAGLLNQEVLLLHQVVNISWRALELATARETRCQSC